MKKKLLFITFLMLFCSTMFGQTIERKYTPANTGQYQDGFTLTTKVSFDGGAVVQQAGMELGVFCGDECRASGMSFDNGLIMVGVLGQDGEFFTFKLYDHNTGIEWIDNTIFYNGNPYPALPFIVDYEYGDLTNPCKIDFKASDNNFYTFDENQYEYDMQVTAIVQIDGVEQTSSELEIGAFCGQDIRGSQKTMYVEGGRYYARMSVYGSNNDNITFKLYDHATKAELVFNDVNTLVFQKDETIGSLADPFEVNFITAPYVAQIGTENYTSFEAALTAAVDGNEITLLENITLAENPTVVSKDININVNGKTVTGTIELAHTGATVTCAEGAVTVTTNVADYKVVYEDGMYKLVAKVYVAQVGDVKYESIQDAVDAAQAGNEIVVIAAIDGEDVVVDKNVTISGSVTLNNVSINAVEGASELTVSGLSFTGNSWINSGAASKLTVTGVSANVTPSNATYTNSRSAFISLGRSEGKQLELIVTDCNIVANGGGDAILGWAAITTATLTGNTFGSETAYQTNSDCVKFMAIAQGAVFNITGNTIYSNYNGIVFGQNTTRDNAYTVNVNTNNFYGDADHIWIEVSGSNTTHATIKATSDNKVNGIAFTAKDIKLHPNLNTFTSYAGVDVVLDVNGKVLGGTFKYVADGVIADGYEKADNNDGTYGIIKSISGKISYRAYVNDTDTREGLGVDLENIVAKESVVVKLYDANGNLLTTTSLKAGGAEAATLTCNIVLWGDPSSSWETTIHATELTVANVPYKIELIIDEQELDTFTNALGEGTNVDETEKYKALDCVLDTPVAKVGNTEYYNINNAIANWTAGSTLTLLTDVTLSDVITLKSTEHHILNLNKYTMTAAAGKNAIEIKSYGFENRSERAALTINAKTDEIDPNKIGTIHAGSKSCIYYKYDATLAGNKYDRPIIYINGGVYEGSSYSGISSTGHNTAQDKCATFNISGGTFNCGLNLTKTKLLTSGGLFNKSVSCTGGSTSIRLISGGTFKSWGWMTADAASKFAVGTAISKYNVGVYVDDKGYLVVGGPVITEAGTTFEASTANYSGWSSYLEYSSAATNGLYYTSVEEALADNNNDTTSSVNIYVSELDLTGTSYKGSLVITDSLTVTFAEGTTPAWKVASGEEDHEVGYTESVANGVVTRVYTLFTPVAKVGEVKYESFEAALNAVQDGETITLLGTTGSEISKEIEFTRAITFTITGTAPNYALPVVTFQNATVNISNAEILIPELDARQNATINVIDSKVYDAGGNSIAKSYYNGAINISGTSEVYMMQVTTMGYINISGTAKLHATWQTNVYGNGLVTISGTSEFNTAALHLTAKDYENRDNTDAERVGKPAEIIVDGANFTVGKVYSSNGADYSYNSSHGINIGTIDGKFAILNVKNGGKVNYHMADGETANVGAGGTVNVNASTFKTQCRDTNGTVTLANNGTFNITGAAILAANVTGDGWFYMNSVAMTEATNLNGAKVRFASGTNNIDGSTIDNGFFQVGIGAYHGQDEKVDTQNGVVVNVTNNAKIGANADTYAGWIGTGFYDTDAEKLAVMTDAKYVLNIENSIAEFGYIHVSNDGELNVSGNATVKAWYNNSDYSFYAGDLIINGTAEFDATDVLAIYTKVSCDNGTDNPGTLNINADTEYEAERHNGAIDGTNFDVRKTGVVNVAANANLHIGEYTSIAADAKMNIAGEATALGTITNNGVITLTTEAAKLTTPELTTNVPTTNVPEYKVVYENGTYIVVAKVYVAEVNGVKYESLQDAFNAGGDIKVIRNFTLPAIANVAADKVVTLDLNGFTISYSSDVAGDAMITNRGNLTITDNTTDKSGKIIYTYTGTPDTNYSKGNYTISNSGILTLNAGTVENATADMSHASYAIDNNSNNYEAILTINGGNVINTNNYAVRQIANKKNILNVNGGKIEGTRAVWIQLPGSNTAVAPEVELNVTDGTLTSTGESNDFKLAVYSYSYGNDMANVKLKISGGTFNGDIALTGGNNKTNVETLNISGGTFNGKDGDVYSYGDDAKAIQAITIKGGEFATNGAEMYAEDNGYIFVLNADGMYEAQEGAYVAQVVKQDNTIVKYTVLNDALAEAQAGETVEIFADTLTQNLDINKAITVVGERDAEGNNLVTFNGKLNITADGATAKNLNVNNGSSTAGYISAKNVLVEGCDVTGGNGFRYCYTAGTVTFKDSKITGAIYGIHFDGSAGGNIVIENCDITGWTSFAGSITNVAITGTNFLNGNYNQLRFYQNAQMTNCTFNPNMTIDFGKDDVDAAFTDCSVTDGSPLSDVIYLGDIAEMGVDVTINQIPLIVEARVADDVDGNGADYYLTLEEAMVNVADNQFVKLYAAVAAEPMTITVSMTLDLNGFTITGTPTNSAAYAVITNRGNLTITDNTTEKLGKIICDHQLAGSTAYAVNTIVNSGTLTIEAGTIENKSTSSNQIGYAIDNNSTSYNSVVVIKGGKVTVSGTSAYYDGIRQFCNSMTTENSVTIAGGEVSSLWMQNPSDGTTRNANDVEGSFLIEGGRLTNLWIEPSANFTGSIIGGHVGNVGRFDENNTNDLENRRLTGFITGGTFGMDVNEYCHEHYDAVTTDNIIWTVEQVIFVMETALANGWNWFSAYVDIDGADGLASIKESLGENGLMVKDGETGKYIQYTASAGTWNGTLTETSSVGMYMIKTSAAIDEFIVEGSAKLDPSDEEMTMAISKGWNYIPYPLDVPQSITTALGFTPQHGDIIKGKGSGAVYMVGTNGQGWFEEFNMEPGQGYMYKSNAATTITFNYSYPTGGAKSSMLANVETIDYHWTVDAHKYANSMNMIAMVNVDGEMVKGGYEVAAFSNEGECRGTARPFYVEDMDAYLMILTIHGEEVENLTFRYYDIDTDTEYELNNVVTYSDNAIVGTIDNPYIFTMNILGIGENSIDNINIYPNPTTTDREINLQAICDKVEVFNALGVKVAEYHNVDTLDALETAGIYVIRITNDNAVKHCRLVVK